MEGPWLSFTAMKPEKPAKRLYDLKEACVYLCMSPNNVKDLIYKGELPYIQVAGSKGKIRIDVADMDAFILKNKIRFAA